MLTYRATMRLRSRNTYPSVIPVLVADIPYPNRREICRILDGDGNGDWKELAHECGFSLDDVNTWSLQFQRSGGSATESLLTRWSHGRPTITDLFYVLIKIKNIRALKSLKDFVPNSTFDLAEVRRFFPGRAQETLSDMLMDVK